MSDEEWSAAEVEAGARAENRYHQVLGAWKMRNGEAWMPYDAIQDMWREVARAAREVEIWR